MGLFTMRIIDCRSPLSRTAGTAVALLEPELLQHLQAVMPPPRW